MDMSPLQRLAVCWDHAGRLADVVLTEHVQTDELIDLLDGASLPARQLTEEVTGFDGDFSDPLTVNAERLMAFAIVPALGALYQGHEEAASLVRTALFADKDEGSSSARVSVIQAILSGSDRLGGYLATDVQAAEVSSPLNVIARTTLCDEMASMLASGADGQPPLNEWLILRFMANDSALPEKVANAARNSLTNAHLDRLSNSLTNRLEPLKSIAAIAVRHDWPETHERLLKMAEAISVPTDVSDELMDNLFELIYLVSRLLDDPLKRTKWLAARIERLGRDSRAQERSRNAARLFAMGLSGQESQPFVDAYAALTLSVELPA
jgi:hypothetical protein